ncbi:hypothetical protein BOX15_Mlig015814g3, partial [Macrostomum lignano]
LFSDIEMSISTGYELDNRLDGLLVLYMQSVSQYLALASSLEARLASGRLGISKTRCSALPAAGSGIGGGSACLGQLQYCEADMSAASATIEVVDDDKAEWGFECDKFALSHNPESGNRALRWFAALPPPSLRAARREFESALSLTVALANEKARMQQLDSEIATIKTNNAIAAKKADAGP